MSGILNVLFSCFRESPAGPSCIFCNVKQETAKTKIVYEDENFVAFEDIRPASKHHYLVTPKEHIRSIKSLDKERIPLLKELEKVGTTLMEQFNVPESERRMGFHIPPFNSINHLHLHVQALPYNSGLSKLMFPTSPGSGEYHKSFGWFVEVGQAVQILESGRQIGVMSC